MSTQVGRRQLVEQQPLNDGLRFIGMMLKLTSIMVFCVSGYHYKWHFCNSLDVFSLFLLGFPSPIYRSGPPRL